MAVVLIVLQSAMVNAKAAAGRVPLAATMFVNVCYRGTTGRGDCPDGHSFGPKKVGYNALSGRVVAGEDGR